MRYNQTVYTIQARSAQISTFTHTSSAITLTALPRLVQRCPLPPCLLLLLQIVSPALIDATDSFFCRSAPSNGNNQSRLDAGTIHHFASRPKSQTRAHTNTHTQTHKLASHQESAAAATIILNQQRSATTREPADTATRSAKCMLADCQKAASEILSKDPEASRICV
jgi:hypothetical protein